MLTPTVDFLRERDLFCDAPTAAAAHAAVIAWVGDGPWSLLSVWQRKDGSWHATLLGPLDAPLGLSPAVVGVPCAPNTGSRCWLAEPAMACAA